MHPLRGRAASATFAPFILNPIHLPPGGSAPRVSIPVLVVHEDEGAAAKLAAQLVRLGYRARALSPGSWRDGAAANGRADLALVDLGPVGVEAAQRHGGPDGVPVVYLADDPDAELLQQADATLPGGYLAPPVGDAQLRLAIRSALSQHARERRRRRAEAETAEKIRELKDQAQLLDTVLQGMLEGVLVASKDGKLLYANPRAVEIFGMPLMDVHPSEWAGKYGFFHEDGKTPVQTEDMPLMQAMTGRPVESRRFVVRNESRREGVVLDAAAFPLRRADDNEIIGSVGIGRDITQQVKAERELRLKLEEIRQHDDLLRAVLESVTEGVVVADSEGRFTLFNRAGERIVGLGMLDIPPDQWTEQYGLFDPDDKTHIPVEELPLSRAIAGKATVEMGIFVRNEKQPDGVYIVVNGQPMRRDVGGHGGGVAVFRDVTEHRRAEQERKEMVTTLREQTELLEAVFDSISEGIVAVDKQGGLIGFNKAARAISGIRYEGVPPKDWAREFGIYYSDGESPMRHDDLPVLRAAFGGDVVVDEDLVMRSPEKPEGITLRVTARPLLDEDGSRRGGIAVFRDVTETRRAEEALAEAFAKGKIEIIDTVLHNVGNAVNSVATGIDTIEGILRNDVLIKRFAGLAKTLDQRDGDWADYVANDPRGRLVFPFMIALAQDLEDREARLAKAAERAKSRTDHIADIIRSQRVFQSRTRWSKQINLRDALADAISVVEQSLASRGVRVDLDCAQAPASIWTHKSDFQQTIVNLLRNAVEAIDARLAGEGGRWEPRILVRSYLRPPYLVTEVEDNALGVPPSKLRAIIAAGYTTKKGGTGLGLHSAATFAKRFGGSVRVNSAGVGWGATTVVELRMSAVGLDEDAAGEGKGEEAATDSGGPEGHEGR